MEKLHDAMTPFTIICLGNFRMPPLRQFDDFVAQGGEGQKGAGVEAKNWKNVAETYRKLLGLAV